MLMKCIALFVFLAEDRSGELAMNDGESVAYFDYKVWKQVVKIPFYGIHRELRDVYFFLK